MSKLVILVDMDDTIENLLEEWVHTLNEQYRRYVLLDDIRCWDVRAAFPGLSDEQVFAPLYTDALWRRVKPKWDAVEYVQKLIDDGHEVYIVTSSNFKTISTKIESILCRYFPYIRMDHVIVCTKKQMIRGDVMIDDGVHNLLGGDYYKVLMTAAHNRDYDAEANGLHRVNSWKEAYALITGYSYAVS